MIVTAETRDIWEKIQIQSTKSRFETHHLKKALTRYSEQKINKVNRVSSFFKSSVKIQVQIKDR